MTGTPGPEIRRGGLGAALGAGGLHAALLAGALLAPGAAPGRWADPAVWAFLVLWVGWSAFEAGLAGPTRTPERLSSRDRADAVLTGAALLAGTWLGLRRAPDFTLAGPWLAAAAGGQAAGVALRLAAVRRLGSGFVTGAQAGASAALVVDGPYRWIRHPSETGLLAASACGAVLLRSGVAVALWAGAILPLAVLRARREDHVLAAAHGSAHEAYRRRTGMLLPRGR